MLDRTILSKRAPLATQPAACMHSFFFSLRPRFSFAIAVHTISISRHTFNVPSSLVVARELALNRAVEFQHPVRAC